MENIAVKRLNWIAKGNLEEASRQKGAQSGTEQYRYHLARPVYSLVFVTFSIYAGNALSFGIRTLA